GLGTSLFVDGRLMPNTELGHIEIRGKDAEERASDRARKKKNMGWTKYGRRLDEYLKKIEALLWPDLIILGGGTSKKSGKFLDELTTRTEVVVAKMHNEAGIAGAALAGVPEKEKTEVSTR
ncbi:MAG: ROK family protein, partial [Rubrobacteraceae bacterium]